MNMRKISLTRAYIIALDEKCDDSILMKRKERLPIEIGIE